MSEANRTAVRVAKETSFRTVPGTPHFQEMRITSESVSYTPTTEVSSEIDSTRQIKDLILTGFEAGGDIGAEYSIGNMDVVMEGIMCGDWNRTPEVFNGASWKYGASATRISAVSATAITLAATSVLSGSSINATGAVFAVGMLVQASGFADAGNNRLIRMSSAGSATSLTITAGVVDAAPLDTARLKVVGFEGVAGDITAVTVGGNALVATALNFTTLGLSVGQWVKISAEGGAYSFAATANAGYARISAITATRLSFDIAPVGWVADAAAGKTIRVYYGDTIRNGVNEYSYRIEKEYNLNVGTRYMYFLGMSPTSMAVSADTRAVITQTVTFLGSEGTIPDAARLAGAVTLPATTGSVLDSSNSVPLILENNAPLGQYNYVSSFAFTLDNGLRAQSAIGQPGAVGLGLGRSDLSGTLATYFGDETLLTKLINNTASSATFSLRDVANAKADLWDVPRLKYSAGVPEITGVDTDIFASLTFQALRDVAGGRDYTVMLCRFDYLA